MSTQHTHRILGIVPLARVNTIVTWFTNNIGANSIPADVGPGLSATGSEPATHRWFCGSYTDSECRLILRQLCLLASVTPPTAGQWNGWTGNQKRSWLASVRAGVLSGYGVFVTLADNEGQWDAAEERLAEMGLKRIQAAIG